MANDPTPQAKPEASPLTPEPDPAHEDAANPAAATTAQVDAADDPKAERIAAIIRNGLNNSPISQTPGMLAALETRLPEITAAILQEA